jgi:stage IV sporulation protein FB
VIFQEPPRTNYDLNFTLFGTPVRIHPFFWLVGLMLGGPRMDFKIALIWLAASFISILIHELGHVLAFNYYGTSAHVVLHGFGGLAIPNSHYGRRDHFSQIVISLAGPFAGFAMAGCILLGLKLGNIPIGLTFGLPTLIDIEYIDLESRYLRILIAALLNLNIFWGLINLAPIYPLDGGQVSASLFQMYDFRDGFRKALILSMGTAIFIGVYFIANTNNAMFGAVFFGYLAYQNYQTLQMLSGRFPGSPW